MKDLRQALVTVLELPLYLAAFVVCWLAAWLCTVAALSVGLLTRGAWMVPPMPDEMARALRMPKRWALRLE